MHKSIKWFSFLVHCTKYHRTASNANNGGHFHLHTACMVYIFLSLLFIYLFTFFFGILLGNVIIIIITI